MRLSHLLNKWIPKILGGSPISTQILQKLKQKCPEDCELKDGYAMTEVPLITRTKQEGSKPGSAGKLVSNVIAKVVDLDTNKSVGPNVSGELLVKGTIFSYSLIYLAT